MFSNAVPMDSKMRTAAEQGDVVSMQTLVASNPEMVYSETPEEKNTALHIAASKGHTWFVHHLLMFINLNVEFVVKDNYDGDTPLHMAVRAGHLQVVEHLIEYLAWARNIQKNLKVICSQMCI